MKKWLLFLVALIPAAPASAQWRHVGSISMSTPCGSDAAYGDALALAYEPARTEPGWVLGGAPGCDINGSVNGGLIQVDVRRGFAPDALRYFVDGAPSPDGRFGQGIATTRNGMIAIAAPGAHNGSLDQAGSISIFFKPNGAQPVAHHSQIAGTLAGQRLGSALAADGDLIAYTYVTTHAIGLDVIRVVPGMPAQYLLQTGGPLGVGFGEALAIRDDGNGRFLLAVGVPGHDGLRGRVELIAPGSPAPSHHDLQLPSPVAGDVFGSSVAIDGQYVFAGAPGRTKPGGLRSGGVAIFVPDPEVPSGHALDRELFPAADQANAFCGDSLAVDASGDASAHVAVGCPFEDVAAAGDERGAVRVFRLGNVGPATVWFESRLTWNHPSQVSTGAHLGHALALAGERVYAGAPRQDLLVNGAGSVEIFARNYDGLFADGLEDYAPVP